MSVTAKPTYPIRMLSAHDSMYGMGWQWITAPQDYVDPTYHKPPGCFKCLYGGPTVGGRGTHDPSGKPISYTYYRPTSNRRACPYPHYSCEPHYGNTWDPGYVAVPGVWVVKRIIDKRGLPVDMGHLHPEIDYYMVQEPSYHLGEGAMASMPGGMPCPWCLSKCDYSDSSLAFCLEDPTHIFEWVPWGG